MSTIFRATLQVILCLPESADEYWLEKITFFSQGFGLLVGEGSWKGTLERNLNVNIWFSEVGAPLICGHCIGELLHEYLIECEQDSVAVVLNGVPELLWNYEDIVAFVGKIRDVNTSR